MDNIKGLELNLTDNSFINNKAINGGALYLIDNKLENKNEIQENKSIVIQNNLFERNTAENFGGAIYSEYHKLYTAKAKKNIFKFNEAHIMGSAAYSPNAVNETLFDFNDNTIKEDDYTSKPAYITFHAPDNNNITTGASFPISFTLYDEFYKPFKDKLKYYSSMTLKVKLTEEDKINDLKYKNDDDDKNNQNINYNIIGNVGSFTNGKKIFFFYLYYNLINIYNIFIYLISFILTLYNINKQCIHIFLFKCFFLIV